MMQAILYLIPVVIFMGMTIDLKHDLTLGKFIWYALWPAYIIIVFLYIMLDALDESFQSGR